jgi:hypothetical protein
MKAIVGAAAVAGVAFAGCSDGVSRLPTSAVVAALRDAGFEKITVYGTKTYTIVIRSPHTGQEILLGCDALSAGDDVAANVCPSVSLAHSRYSLGHGFGLRPRGDYRLICNVILAVDRKAAASVRARFESAVAILRTGC